MQLHAKHRFCRNWLAGEQEWCSGERWSVPPIWPTFESGDPGLGEVVFGSNLMLVDLVLAPRAFRRVTRVLLFSSLNLKPTFLNSKIDPESEGHRFGNRKTLLKGISSFTIKLTSMRLLEDASRHCTWRQFRPRRHTSGRRANIRVHDHQERHTFPAGALLGPLSLKFQFSLTHDCFPWLLPDLEKRERFSLS